MSSFTPLQNIQCVPKLEWDIVQSYLTLKKIQKDQGVWSNTVTNKNGLEQLLKHFSSKLCKHMQKSHGIQRVLAPRASQTILLLLLLICYYGTKWKWSFFCDFKYLFDTLKSTTLDFIKNGVIHYSLWLLRKRTKTISSWRWEII